MTALARAAALPDSRSRAAVLERPQLVLAPAAWPHDAASAPAALPTPALPVLDARALAVVAPSESGEATGRLLVAFFGRLAVPKQIVTDGGSGFLSARIKAKLARLARILDENLSWLLTGEGRRMRRRNQRRATGARR